MSRVPKMRWHKTLWKNNGHCWYCGREAETVDHAKPRSRKGTNRNDNLVPACLRCNNMKGDLFVREWRRMVRILVCRRLFSMGIFIKEWEKFPILFFGEGNLTPLQWD